MGKRNYGVSSSRRYGGPGFESAAPSAPNMGRPPIQYILKAGPVKRWADMTEAEREAIRKQLGATP